LTAVKWKRFIGCSSRILLGEYYYYKMSGCSFSSWVSTSGKESPSIKVKWWSSGGDGRCGVGRDQFLVGHLGRIIIDLLG
jgi:hypothetical protein